MMLLRRCNKSSSLWRLKELQLLLLLRLQTGLLWSSSFALPIWLVVGQWWQDIDSWYDLVLLRDFETENSVIGAGSSCTSSADFGYSRLGCCRLGSCAFGSAGSCVAAAVSAGALSYVLSRQATLRASSRLALTITKVVSAIAFNFPVPVGPCTMPIPAGRFST